MSADRAQRKMAAILAADVVGYSRLMGEDEEHTLATLKAYGKIVDALIGQYGGRIFGSAGDSVIAEFTSPVEAVRCATEIQLTVHKQNSEAPEDRRMRFRIGVNLGDVVVDGENLMGDGVNVAARLEALAPPGGICVSESIHLQVRDRLGLDFLDLGEHKMKNIARPVRAYRVPLASEERVESPFRGLEAFDFDHADLFFGRARAIAACTERLEQQAANGKAFLLIYGMSGSGKSSLLRAGLLPAITRPGAVAGITLWRRCLIRPSEGVDAIASLAAGLLREDALPELARDRTATELADLLRSAPDRALALIRAALGKAATTASLAPSQARLALAVDQMEELFTTETDPASREALVQLLATFAASGFLWVIGTIRADFFHRCGEVPGFSALKDGLSSYELLPPNGPEIAQIIREPARAAGLRFEEAADQGRLEDVLQEAASADPGSLPLLEFVLDALYEAGRDRRLLTFAAYRALGGLEGAVARRADEVVDALPPDIQEALPAVLRALTTVRLGDDAVTAGPASLADVAGTPAQSALVDALVATRLLVTDENTEGHAVVRVAHEALLNRWPRARNIVNTNREFLETRARLRTDARRWHSDNKNPELLLPAGKRLAEAEELLLARREEVDDQIIDYIEASSLARKAEVEKERQAERARIEAAEAARRERLERQAERQSLETAAATRLARRTRMAAVIALILAIGAGAGAFIGFRGQQEALRQAERAEENADQARSAETQARSAETQARAASTEALAARNEALRSQSLSLSFLSQQTAASGETEAAILLALEGLPTDMSSPDRPYLPEAEAALYEALSEHRQSMVFRHDGGVTHAAFNPSGDRIVTASFDRTARIWNVEDGSQVAVLNGHQAMVERALFSPDGRRVVTAARDGTARIWNAVSGEEIFVLDQPGEVHTAMFSPDGRRVLTASELSDPATWDALTGEKVATVQSPTTSAATFAPDGRTFATSEGPSRTVRIWNTGDGRQIRSWPHRSWGEDILFSPDGSRLLTISWNSPAGLWEVSSGSAIAALGGHSSNTYTGTFSHDGRLVATVSIEGTARLWDGVTGELRRVLGEETGVTYDDVGMRERDQDINGAFSPDDKLFATASIHGMTHIWNAESGLQLAAIRGHRGVIEHVAFSPTDNRLVTASHDGTARVWDIDGVLTTTLRHPHPSIFAAFSPDDSHVVTLGEDNVAHVWDVATGSEIATLEGRGGGPLQHAAFSPDGRRVATASQGGRIFLWEVETGRELARFEGHSAGVRHVQFSLNGSYLLSTSLDGTVRLWDASTGAQLIVLDAGGALQLKALFSPDGKLIVAGSSDGTVRVWKTDGTEVKTLATRENRISVTAMSPDGRLLATGSFDGTLQLRSITDGGVIATFEGHNEPVTDVAFSQDGRSILTASRDRTARIWNVESKVQKVILKGHNGVVNSAAFSPNGLYAVTASAQDRTVRLWVAGSGRETAILAGEPDALGKGPKITAAEFSSDGTQVAIISGDEMVQIVRVFPALQDMIDFAHNIVRRELTDCERRRFFLPTEGKGEDCPG